VNVLDSCAITAASTVDLMPLDHPEANAGGIESASALAALHTAPDNDRLFGRKNARDLSGRTRRRRSRLPRDERKRRLRTDPSDPAARVVLVASSPAPAQRSGCFSYKYGVLPLAAGVTLFLVMPHPWNGVGLAVALLWEIAGTVYGLCWSHRATPLVGTSTLIGPNGTIVVACRPRGRVKIGGETWQAHSRVAIDPGEQVRVRSVEKLTLHVEPEQPATMPPLQTDGPLASTRSVGSHGGWLWLL
jgi:membrane protein implicated in regulation of membrane protease activity